MTYIDTLWLADFDNALLGYFAIDHSDAGMDRRLLSRYACMPPMEAALAFGNDFDLDRADALWPPPGLTLHS